jgi:hypothetical protein
MTNRVTQSGYIWPDEIDHFEVTVLLMSFFIVRNSYSNFSTLAG